MIKKHNVKNLKAIGKKVLVSMCLSAGVLAIANVDSVWQERLHTADYNPVRLESRQKFRARMAEVAPRIKEPEDSEAGTQLASFNTSLSQDEIGNRNPFANLSSLDPLSEIMNKGIVRFQRQAYRSPDYRKEAGYDLVEYEVIHPDRSQSTILAYMETPLVDDPSVQPVPVVMIVTAESKDQTKQTLYRDGNLVEQNQLSTADAHQLITQRLNAGIPFFSVSR
jgi:hypothetical protein